MSQTAAAEKIIANIRARIESGELRPGDRLQTERELAVQMGLSRSTIRTGLRSLAAMGVVQSRQGAGTFICSGPPALASEPLGLMAALHGISRNQLFEARRVLEVGTVGLAAERASAEQLAAISDEVIAMYAAMDRPQEFLLHDVRFHQVVAAASGNPILSGLIEMVASLFYEQRRLTIDDRRGFREAADMHRRIFEAIRSRSAEAAGAAMDEHLKLAQSTHDTTAARGSSIVADLLPGGFISKTAQLQRS